MPAKKLNGVFDLIVMIDVTQHITRKSEFNFAIRNIHGHLAEGGILIAISYLAPKKEYIESRPYIFPSRLDGIYRFLYGDRGGVYCRLSSLYNEAVVPQ